MEHQRQVALGTLFLLKQGSAILDALQSGEESVP
jgi:hypothetical protein